MNRKLKKAVDGKGDKNKSNEAEQHQEEELQAQEEEIETQNAELEGPAIMFQDMEQVRNNLATEDEDSQTHIIQVSGLQLCSIAKALLQGFEPLQTLTKGTIDKHFG